MEVYDRKRMYIYKNNKLTGNSKQLGKKPGGLSGAAARTGGFTIIIG